MREQNKEWYGVEWEYRNLEQYFGKTNIINNTKQIPIITNVHCPVAPGFVHLEVGIACA